jgi:hypothetical protein
VDIVRWRSEPGRGGTNRSFVSQNPSNGAKLWYALPKKAERVVARIVDIQGELVSEVTGKSEPGMHLVNWDLTQSAARPRGTGQGGGQQGGRRAGPGSGQRPDQARQGRGRTETAGGTAPADENPGGGVPSGRGQTEGGGADPAASTGQSANTPATPPAQQEESDAEGQQTPTGQTPPGSPAAGRPPQGFQGFRGARPVPNGTYKVQLLVDGKEVGAYSITVNRDPNLPENAVADELFELELLLEKQAKEDKFQNKSNGRGNYSDD